ncbi:hypothetical protein AYI68_g6293 [Smittium mucronatum]|uniref:Uncharacterized protein n=1 Tax=Smittium mucronatum TaxID=133383 RepID=A0A1R0GRV4_9FUNG|nr:hypothetical protein AYI68_g6293 [Smittium mucronatum]
MILRMDLGRLFPNYGERKWLLLFLKSKAQASCSRTYITLPKEIEIGNPPDLISLLDVQSQTHNSSSSTLSIQFYPA